MYIPVTAELLQGRKTKQWFLSVTESGKTLDVCRKRFMIFRRKRGDSTILQRILSFGMVTPEGTMSMQFG